jgi:Fe-S oxidoreductase
VSNDWINIFNKLGLSVKPISTGCCGMAGTYGHEKKNQELSRGIYDLSWGPTLSDRELTTVMATGFSCRSQVKRYEGEKLLHPIQVIAKNL